MASLDVRLVLARHWAEGGAGADEVAREVVEIAERGESDFRFVYDEKQSLWDKMKTIATKIYGAARHCGGRQGPRTNREAAGGRLRALSGLRSQDAILVLDRSRRARRAVRPTVNIREVRLAAGAEFIVMVCGDVMTMPGLPKVPSADRIDIDEKGRVVGLF